MKNRIIKLTLFTLLICMVISLVGCDFLNNVSNQLDCDHDYKIVSTTATCELDGETKYVCEKCQREMTVKVKATGHNFEVLSQKEPTCSVKGSKTEKCSVCGFEHTVEIDCLPHTFEIIEDVDSTCLDAGYTINKCKVCGEEVRTDKELASHKYGEWIEKVKATDEHDGTLEHECSVCHHTETKTVQFMEGLDLSVVKYNFEEKGEYIVNSFDELVLLFNSAILNLKSKLICVLKFEFDDFNTMFNNLCAAKSVPFDYKVNASLQPLLLGGSKLILDFEIYVNPSKSTPQNKVYIQRNSLNYDPITPTRNSEFDSFKINNASYSYSGITSTEQLVYLLERRVKPVCVSGSNAERVYNNIKSVLRNICNDSMTDTEKLKAIHDWIIMNVTYDQELYELLYAGETDLKSYTGFYLEGVFDRHNAVCEGISKAFCAMANVEGIPCVRVTGYQTGHPSGVGHAWNKVYVDGDWYIVDATSDGTIIGGTHEVLSYAYFMISEATMKQKYTGKDYETYVCNKDYNIFEDQEIFVSGEYHSLSVKDNNELAEVFRYLKDNGESGVTIQVYLDYEFSDVSIELSKASTKALYFSGYSQVNSGNIVMIIKN